MPAPLPSRFDSDETQRRERFVPPRLLADPALDERASDTTVMSAAELPSALFPPRPQIKRVRAPAFERASRVFASAPPAVDTEPMLGARAPHGRATAFPPAPPQVAPLQVAPLITRAPTQRDAPPVRPAPAVPGTPHCAMSLLAALGGVLLLLVPLGAPRAVARWFPVIAPAVTMATARAVTTSARRPLAIVGPVTAPAKTSGDGSVATPRRR
jgi:hypothetical protein